MTTREKGVRNPLAALVDLADEEKLARGVMHTPIEILQQPVTWQGTFSRVLTRRAELQRFLAPVLPATRQETPTVYLVGAGTSDYIGRALTSVLRQKWQCEVVAVPSTELITNVENYVLPGRPYLWISFSRSGDSSEGVGVLESAMQRYPEIRHLVVTCNRDGKMSRLCGGQGNAFALLLEDAVNDRGLAMTSSFSNMVVAGHALAHIQALEEYRPILDALSEMGSNMLSEGPAIADSVSQLQCRKTCFLGTGALAAAATESGLKALELTAGAICTMAESTMGLRHGPMSALDEETVVVLSLSSEERRRRYEVDLLEEIRAKKLGRVCIVIAPRENEKIAGLCDHLIALHAPAEFPDDYRVPVDVVFGQLYGLFSSIAAGLQPDHPSPNGAIHRVVSGVRIYD